MELILAQKFFVFCPACFWFVVHENMFRHQTLDSQTFKMDGWALIEVGFVTTFFLFKGHTLVQQNIDCWFSNDPLKLRVKISAALKPKKKLIFFCIMGFLAPAETRQICMVHVRCSLFDDGRRRILLADGASGACGPERLCCGRKLNVHCNISPSGLCCPELTDWSRDWGTLSRSLGWDMFTRSAI